MPPTLYQGEQADRAAVPVDRALRIHQGTMSRRRKNPKKLPGRVGYNRSRPGMSHLAYGPILGWLPCRFH